MSKLNSARVKSEKAQSKEVRIPDGSGLFLRIRPSGAKSWLFCFRLPNDRTLLQMTIGSVNDVSLKEAREILPELRKQVAQGLDPRRIRAAAKTDNAEATTMQSLFDAWIEFTKIANNITQTWIKRHEARWKLHLQKPLGNLLARDVTRAHLATALDSMTRKSIKEETRKALTTLNLMMDYGLTRHIIEQNPARMLKPKDFAASANRACNRALSLKELRKLWVALDQATAKRKGIAKTSSMSPITATAIKLLILTGARRGEVAGMRWDEISDLDHGIWSLPSERTKNRQPHTIYLGSLGIELLRALQPLTGGSPYVFDTGNNNHIHTDSLTTAITRLKKNVDSLSGELKPFTIHDLRRSAATAWAEHLKIKPHIIEHMLNHQPLNKLIATYQRATYVEEQKSAWSAWDEMIKHHICSNYNNVILISNAVNF